MKCFGMTKKRSRCKNNTNLIYCKLHARQPIVIVSTAVVVFAFWAGLFQDALKPIYSYINDRIELKKDIAVSIEKGRRASPKWRDDIDSRGSESDIVSLYLGKHLVKVLEIYHTAKNQRFRDNVTTELLTYEATATEANYKIIDLDGDGVNEVMLFLENRIYGFHGDKLLNVLILDPKGNIIASAPTPRSIEWVNQEIISPYSGFRSSGIMIDGINSSQSPISYCNGFNIINTEKSIVLSFSLVIDNAPYSGNHLHSVEDFKFDGTILEAIDEEPKFFISSIWNEPFSGQQVSASEAADFLRKHNNPKFEDLMKKYEPSSNGAGSFDNEYVRELLEKINNPTKDD